MTRHRRQDELVQLPGVLRTLVDAGHIKDARELIPVHDRFGEPRFIWPKRSLDDIVGLCIHHSAGTNDNPVLTAIGHAKPGDRITSDGRGSPGLNYTFAITKQEQPPLLCNHPQWETWSQGGKPGHPADENRHLVAILVMGWFDEQRGGPTQSQVDRLWKLIAQLRRAFDLHPKGIFGHADFGKPACPGPQLYEAVKRRREMVPGLDTVEQWQIALVFLGYELGTYGVHGNGVDGVWGRRSRQALSRYQRERGVRVTNERDPITELLLLRDYDRERRKRGLV